MTTYPYINKNMDYSPNFSDFYLILDNDEKFPVHRFILAKVPFFKNLFDNNREDHLKITNFPAEPIKITIKCIYMNINRINIQAEIINNKIDPIVAQIILFADFINYDFYLYDNTVIGDYEKLAKKTNNKYCGYNYQINIDDGMLLQHDICDIYNSYPIKSIEKYLLTNLCEKRKITYINIFEPLINHNSNISLLLRDFIINEIKKEKCHHLHNCLLDRITTCTAAHLFRIFDKDIKDECGEQIKLWESSIENTTNTPFNVGYYYIRLIIVKRPQPNSQSTPNWDNDSKWTLFPKYMS